MRTRLRSWWKQIKKHPVATVLIALLAAVIALIFLSIFGYIFNWGWTGLGPYISPPHPKDSDFQRGKTLWDWLQLLIIPLMFVIGGYWFNEIQKNRDEIATKQRDKTERDIAADNQQEAALQAYIDKISELLEKYLRDSQPQDELRTIARVRTLTTLPRLDKTRKASLIQFLWESRLITKDHKIIDLEGANLVNANLSGAILRGGVYLANANLVNANLSETKLPEANLPNANLTNANLSGVDLSGADLWGAKLRGAILTNAILKGAKVTDEQLAQAKSFKGAIMPDGKMYRNSSGANLSEAVLYEADLSGVDLSGADLSEADLSEANLSGVDLSNTDLSGSNLTGVIGFTTGQLAQAKSLKGAIMPDGEKHE